MHLSDTLSSHFRLDIHQKTGLKKLGLVTVRDLLFYFPTRYTDMSVIKRVADLTPGETATLYGVITNPKTKKTFKSKTPMAEATFTDETGSLKVMWFHQAYIAKMLHGGEKVILTGKVMEGKHGLYFSNPEFEKIDMLPIDSHDSLFKKENAASGMFGYPVYSETRAITSKWIYHAIDRIFKSGVLDSIEDYIPEPIIKKYSLPTLRTALIWIHTPKKSADAESARKRFAFEEVFLIQLAKQQDRHLFKQNNSYTIAVDDTDIEDFVGRFPFAHTSAQTNAIATILADFKKLHPMARLLEGDVGSGKTAVAATVSYAIIKNRPPKPRSQGSEVGRTSGTDVVASQQTFGNLQVAYMAPTEILATQLFENFITYFKHTGINIGLITGSGCRKFPSKVAASALSGGWTTISRAQLLKWVASGEIPILVGTHALIQKKCEVQRPGARHHRRTAPLRYYAALQARP
jgi:ATP-dependent DNA helicase RecG